MQYVTHVLFGVPLQRVVHPADVSVHAAQLHPGDGVAVGVGGGGGVGRGVGRGVGIGVAGRDVAVGGVVLRGATVGATLGPTAAGGGVTVHPGWPGSLFGCVGAPVAPGAIAVACDVSVEGPGDGLGTPATPDTARTVAVAAVAMPMPPAPPNPPKLKRRPRTGSWATHAPTPIVRQRRPTETLRNARTTMGSSCVPATRTSSLRAAAMLIDLLYGRGAVITS
jgi:hypothetical protein